MIVRGQCLCGAVQFAITPPLGEITHCHCRSCRLSRGVAFVTWTSVPPERFTYVTGESEMNWYASSPGVSWGSCKAMLYVAEQWGHVDAPKLGHIYVPVGSLTDPIDDRPVAHVSYEERVAWHEPHDSLPKYRAKTDERMT